MALLGVEELEQMGAVEPPTSESPMVGGDPASRSPPADDPSRQPPTALDTAGVYLSDTGKSVVSAFREPPAWIALGALIFAGIGIWYWRH